MDTTCSQTTKPAVTDALRRSLRWLWLPLFLLAVVSAGQHHKLSDHQATVTQFVADFSAIDANSADDTVTPDHDDFVLSYSVAIAALGFIAQALPARAPQISIVRAFAPRAPPISLHF